eukprot:7196131-Lingulodinium_polyedra.AAC.1
MADEWLAARKGVPVPRAAPPAVRKRPTPRQIGREGQASDRRADVAILRVRRLRSLQTILARQPQRAGQRPGQAQH